MAASEVWNVGELGPCHVRTRDRFETITAQTLGKTRSLRRPKGKGNHQDDLVCEICKTSIPGSNPGGASNFTVQIRSSVRAWCKRLLRDGLKLRPSSGSQIWQCIDSSRVVRGRSRQGGGLLDLYLCRALARIAPPGWVVPQKPESRAPASAVLRAALTPRSFGFLRRSASLQ
jgi:hypothetical protein